MATSSVRLGVDIGGTFTDVVLEHSGQTFSTKVLTTYTAPEDAIIDGMHQVLAKADIKPSQIDLNKEIKKIGFYEAIINLHPEVQAKIHIEVVKTENKS